MSKWIYINLFIDNDWDNKKIIDQIYNLKLDSSEEILKSYSHFGLFLSREEDQVIVETPVEMDFLSYLSANFGPMGSPRLINENLSFQESDKIVVAGVSEKEERLFGREILARNKIPAKEKFKFLNSKDLLFKLSQQRNFKFPVSCLVPLKSLNLKDGEISCLKFLTSAGGRGVFKITSENKMLDFIFRQIEEEDLEDLIVLKQKYIDIKEQFYTVCDTDLARPVYQLSIDYDEKGNSRAHRVKQHPSSLQLELSRSLAEYLVNEGYAGSFGFDGFISKNGEVFPATDLNVRLDKSRILMEAALRYKEFPKLEFFEFRRERTSLAGQKNFKVFKETKLALLKHEKFKLVVLLCSNLFGASDDNKVSELTFFVGREKGSSEKEYQEWLKYCYEVLSIN